jgi:UDP-N-acetylmuramate dehydrogenase
MPFPNVLRFICANIRPVTTPVREYVPLAPFTTLGVGGPARYFIRADSEKTVRQAFDFSKAQGLPLLVIGGGSNLLVADEGFPGVVLRVEIPGLEWKEKNDRVRLFAGAGEEWDHVAAQVVARGLYGVECLSGIPGSVGGTPIQNVGAYGQEVSQTLFEVLAFDRLAGSTVQLSHKECLFSYRSSLFNTSARNRYIVLQVAFEFLREGRPYLLYPDLKREFGNRAEPSLQEVREAVLRIRAGKSMLLRPDDPNTRSAGSFFKNPIVTRKVLERIEAESGLTPPQYPATNERVKVAAAWLIEQVGISKGYRKGRAGISTNHTLALVNTGGATAAELVALAREVRDRVEDRFGIRLVPEPVLIGFGDF